MHVMVAHYLFDYVVLYINQRSFNTVNTEQETHDQITPLDHATISIKYDTKCFYLN